MMVPQVVAAARVLESGDSLLRLWRESGKALLVRGVFGLDSSLELGLANVASIQ